MTMKKTKQEEGVLDVLILGAGWSGLGAARRLLDLSQKDKRPVRLRILEARDYVGGRSKTVYPSLDGTTSATQVELGSQWIHGATQRNPVYQLALEQDMVLHTSSESFAAWQEEEGGRTSAPKRMSEEECTKLERDLLKGRKGFYAFLDRYHQTIKRRFLLRKSGAAQASVRQVLDEYAKKRKLTPQQKQYLIWLVDADLSGDNACSLEDLSAKYYDDGKTFSGGDVQFGMHASAADQGTIAGGYSNLVESFAAPLVKHVQCGCVVTAIDYGSDLAAVEYHNDGHGAVPQRILARRVLCTVPLGVLKEGSISFHPPLPPRKQQAIQSLGMGLYNKVVLMWDPQARDHLPWLDGDHRNAEERMWMERIPLPGTAQGPWTQCYNPSIHHAPDHPILLYFFLAGGVAAKVEKLSDKEVQEQALHALNNWFPTEGGIPQPDGLVVTRWKQDPYSRGSYSFYSLASKPDDRKALASPLKGEATNFDYFATTHGALMSGQEAAESIWRTFKA